LSTTARSSGRITLPARHDEGNAFVVGGGEGTGGKGAP
jgi:hypothetical protein